jgi:hypothetical protein
MKRTLAFSLSFVFIAVWTYAQSSTAETDYLKDNYLK